MSQNLTNNAIAISMISVKRCIIEFYTQMIHKKESYNPVLLSRAKSFTL